MMVNMIKVLTEYMSIIFCLHKAAAQKIKVDKYVVMFLGLNIISVFCAHRYREKFDWIIIIVYTNFLVYTKMRLCSRWNDAIKCFGIMLITIPSLQMIIYFTTKFVFESITTKNEYGILVNCSICFIILLWKEKYIYIIAQKIKKVSGGVILLLFILFFAYLLDVYKKAEFIYKPVTLQTLGGIVGFCIIFALWLNTEDERKRKAKELQMYEVYNNTFEEAITAIRIRQHEFDNHINAIKCLQFTIENPDELVKVQTEYCDKILTENSFNRLLKLHMEPILVGFLYSKFTNAREQDIVVIHDIHSIEFAKKIEISELIEVIGILVDNAIEALRDVQDAERILLVKLHQENETKISLEVANKSCKYLNTEIEKFCTYGYSTKGADRGVGLSRVKEIVKKYKAEFYIENVNYNEGNFLSFKIILLNK